MSFDLAKKIINFIANRTPQNERLEIGFFGGEPLLEFNTIKKINDLIEEKIKIRFDKTCVSIISNGTIFSDEIGHYIDEHKIGFGISCDGIPIVHNRNRVFRNGKPTSNTIEKTIWQAKNALNRVFINVVYQPVTLKYLPETIDYLSDLGIRQIYLNPDYSSLWGKDDIAEIQNTFTRIAKKYVGFYEKKDPHFISLIDGKIALILRGGYQLLERCRMGKGELAFTPDGKIYPCERLVSSNYTDHSIGNIQTGIDLNRIKCNKKGDGEINTECLSCSLKNHCMNWCGCSNYFATGYYNRVNAFICESEKASIRSAMEVIKVLSQKRDPLFCDHLAGVPLTNSII